MLAFDANEFLDARVRQILADNGWFQTVLSDLPHFTYLGLIEQELPDHGLKPVEVERPKVLDSGCRVKCAGIRPVLVNI